jgi:hypothetical protein
MKKIFFAIMTIILLASCTCICKSPAIPIVGDNIIWGLWGSNVVVADDMKFETPTGIRTFNLPVQIVGHDWQWYLWTKEGYGVAITRIE